MSIKITKINRIYSSDYHLVFCEKGLFNGKAANRKRQEF
jgi:hypothetical protein